VQRVGAALTNGAEHAEYLKLEHAQENAVADILIRSEGASQQHCSGVLVGAQLVLTARHCIEGGDADALWVAFGPDSSGRRFETTAELAVLHPLIDVAVLALRDDPAAATDVAPLPIADSLPSEFGRGSLVQLAGYGRDAHGESGEREFVVASVSELLDDAIEVSAAGLGGACFGDSGGPLLVRTAQGHAAVAGVLRTGSVSCLGRDTYTLLEPVADWLVDGGFASYQPSTAIEHSALGTQGRCFDAMAVWSEVSELQARPCLEDQECAFSSSAQGYRCVPRGLDPCEGISELGRCEDEVALHCDRGVVERTLCGSCGSSCGRSPKTGAAICVAGALQPDSRLVPDGG
jgi:hypothetical protein